MYLTGTYILRAVAPLALAIGLLGAATPQPDATLSLPCLQEHQPISDGDAAAVSLNDHGTVWGACIVLLKDGTSYETWWKLHGKDWKMLGSHVPVGTSGATIAKKGYGISEADADALAKAVHKPKPTQ